LENYLSDRIGAKVDLVEKSRPKPTARRRILEEVMPMCPGSEPPTAELGWKEGAEDRAKE